MGKYTGYWEEYSKARSRDGMRMSAALVGGIVGGVLLSRAREPLGLGDFYSFLTVAFFMGFLILLIAIGKNIYDVLCPECGAHYQRSKFGGECPSCGLKFLQHDP